MVIFLYFYVFDPKSFLIGGLLPTGGESINNSIGNGGIISRYKPLTTYIVPITNIIISQNTITLTCPNHNLQLGDSVTLNNIKTTPPIPKHPTFLFILFLVLILLC
jgi:hypothetical protein